jgi:hypothetical protein
MTATAAPLLKQRADARRIKVPAAVAVLYENTMAFINASGFADDDTASGVNRLRRHGRQAGRQFRRVGGDLSVELEREGSWVFLGSGFAQSSVGQPLFALDNQTTTLTGVAGTHIGTITEYIDSTHVRADIEAATALANGRARTRKPTRRQPRRFRPHHARGNRGTTNATTTRRGRLPAARSQLRISWPAMNALAEADIAGAQERSSTH